MTAAVRARGWALPPGAHATAPPERRGLARDEVRLLVAGREGVAHARFHDLPAWLRAGDLLVVNTSATLPAALPLADGAGAVHVAGVLDDGAWVVEPRRADNRGPAGSRPGEVLAVAGGLRLAVAASYPVEGDAGSRLWRVHPTPAVDAVAHLCAHGRPIRYGYVERDWPLADYQTVFASEPGSAEMPSAGRPFTDRLVTRLVGAGARIAPVVLHTGVSSGEKHEPPAPERYRVPAATARLVNVTRAEGGRVIAVGTTVVRALETACDARGQAVAAAGWTDVVIGPGRPVRLVDGLVTGLHEPEASHLLMLDAVAGAEVVARAYAEAVATGYLWHEFGDTMLLAP